MKKEELKIALLDMKFNKNKTVHDYDIFNNNSKKSILREIMNLMKEDITNFSFDDINDLTYMFQALDLLSFFIKGDRILQKQIIKMLGDFHVQIVNIIKNRPDDLDRNARGRYEILKNIVDKIEDTNLRLIYLPLDTYDDAKNEFIYYLIFVYKNYDLVKSSIKLYPHIVNLRNNNESILEIVIDRYLSHLNDYLNNFDLLPEFMYYKDILKLILEDEKLSYSTADKKNYLKKIKKFAREHNYQNKEQKERFTYYINFLTMSLNGDDTSYFEDINYEYDTSETFNNAVQSEAYKIYINTSFTDFSNDNIIVTYDDPAPFEIDDALSVTKDGNDLILHVYISNVVDSIPLSSILYDEAFKRSESKYIDERCIPIYPSILSLDKLSLIEQKVRPAFNYHFRFDMSRGKLNDFKVEKNNIKVTKNLLYEDFDNAFYKGTGDPEFVRLVYDLCQISPIIEKTFNKDKIFFEATNCKSISMGKKVNANAMLYTGYNVAEWFYEHKLPFPFRNCKISDEKIDRLKELRKSLLLPEDKRKEFNRIILNEYPRAYYSSKCEGHSPLGVPYYGTITSPLRKDIDSLGERVEDKFMLNTYTDDDIEFYADLVDKTCKNVNSRTHINKMYEEAYASKLTAGRK